MPRTVRIRFRNLNRWIRQDIFYCLRGLGYLNEGSAGLLGWKGLAG